MGETPMPRLHPRILIGVIFVFLAQIIQQIDKIRLIQFEPLRNLRRSHPAASSERGDHLLFQLRIGNVANANHIKPRMLSAGVA